MSNTFSFVLCLGFWNLSCIHLSIYPYTFPNTPPNLSHFYSERKSFKKKASIHKIVHLSSHEWMWKPIYGNITFSWICYIPIIEYIILSNQVKNTLKSLNLSFFFLATKAIEHIIWKCLSEFYPFYYLLDIYFIPLLTYNIYVALLYWHNARVMNKCIGFKYKMAQGKIGNIDIFSVFSA